MSVTSTTFLANMKIIYGTIQDQVSVEPAFMNLLQDGKNFAQAVNNIGVRGYVFEARLRPNFYMGFRPESATAGVGASGNQGLANATVNLKYGYVPETITGQAEILSKGNAKAFMQAKALEVKYSTKDMVSHMNQLAVGADRGGQLASVASSPAPSSTVFYADNTSGFPGAIYLRLGMPIDTYTVGGMTTTTVSSEVITAINYATRAVTKTTTTGTPIAAEAVTLGGESCSVANYPTTMEGLISLVSDSGSIQGLNPSTSGQESWASYVEDAAGDDLSAATIHRLRQFIKNRGGLNPDLFIFPPAQTNQLTKFATEEYRYETSKASGLAKKALDLGFDVFKFAGTTIVEDKDARPDRIFAGASETMMKFEAIPLGLADDEAGTWTRIIATTGVVDAVVGLLRTYMNIGTVQRSAWGCVKSLSVDDAFMSQAITI
jgi:hypothetical protein